MDWFQLALKRINISLLNICRRSLEKTIKSSEWKRAFNSNFKTKSKVGSFVSLTSQIRKIIGRIIKDDIVLFARYLFNKRSPTRFWE